MAWEKKDTFCAILVLIAIALGSFSVREVVALNAKGREYNRSTVLSHTLMTKDGAGAASNYGNVLPLSGAVATFTPQASSSVIQVTYSCPFIRADPSIGFLYFYVGVVPGVFDSALKTPDPQFGFSHKAAAVAITPPTAGSVAGWAPVSGSVPVWRLAIVDPPRTGTTTDWNRTTVHFTCAIPISAVRAALALTDDAVVTPEITIILGAAEAGRGVSVRTDLPVIGYKAYFSVVER